MQFRRVITAPDEMSAGGSRQNTAVVPGSANECTDFYLTDEQDGGMTAAQQLYIADLVMAYRRRFPALVINAVWDFGKEEGDPAEGPKYGRFSESKVHAVYNAQMLTVSLNHALLRGMPCEADAAEIQNIMREYQRELRCTEKAAHLEGELLSDGLPWPKVGDRMMQILDIRPCRENGLRLRDPYFADVQAIRRLEDTQSLERILVHEMGHMLFEESGVISDRRLRKLFAGCRDGFEDLYEFCAECFMAAEMTRKAPGNDNGERSVIPLAEEVMRIFKDSK